MQHKIEIKNRKGQKIVALLNTPKAPIGLAFTLHGLGGFKEQPHIETLVDTLLDHNYIVVNFDATNSLGESEGKYEDATVQNHYEDLVDVISWTKTQEWYREPFVLAGHSLGGYAVARYAEDYSKEVKAVFPYALFIAGEFSLKAHSERIQEWKETGWKEEQSKSKPGVIKRLPWSHMEERLKHDLRPKASNLSMPVLFVVGSEDLPCTPESQKALYDLVPGDKEFHLVDGAPHTFKQAEHLQQLKNIFNKWLEKIK